MATNFSFMNKLLANILYCIYSTNTKNNKNNTRQDFSYELYINVTLILNLYITHPLNNLESMGILLYTYNKNRSCNFFTNLKHTLSTLLHTLATSIIRTIASFKYFIALMVKKRNMGSIGHLTTGQILNRSNANNEIRTNGESDDTT